jgi:hypothetical protein
MAPRARISDNECLQYFPAPESEACCRGFHFNMGVSDVGSKFLASEFQAVLTKTIKSTKDFRLIGLFRTLEATSSNHTWVA